MAKVAKKAASKKVKEVNPEKKTASKKVASKKVKEVNTEKVQNLQDAIVLGMQEKKALDITIIDLQGLRNSIADYFIICSGNSGTQVDAITDSIEKEVFKLTSENPWHKEGKQNNEWVLLDYVNVVVHVFIQERRKFYGLEALWGDAKITNIENQ